MALQEQKLDLTTKDLEESRTRAREKDAELRELQKEHYEVRVREQELKQRQ